MQQDKLALFYVYDDDDDVPYIVRNPPDNLEQLLAEWNRLDRRYCEDEITEGDGPDEWVEVDIWLKRKGVDLIEVQ